MMHKYIELNVCIIFGLYCQKISILFWIFSFCTLFHFVLVLYNTILLLMFLAWTACFDFLLLWFLYQIVKYPFSVAKFLVGSPSRSLADNILRFMALNLSPSEKPYSLPHCCFTGAVKEEHIMFIIFLLVHCFFGGGTEIPCIFTTKVHTSILLSSKS